MTIPEVTPNNFSFFQFERIAASNGADASFTAIAAVSGHIINVVRLIISSDIATTLSVVSNATTCLNTMQFGATTNGVLEPITNTRGVEGLFQSESGQPITVNKGNAGAAVSATLWYYLEPS